MLTFAAFLVAIGVLVTVHEWGHFRMARACGVKVQRFSVGFGPRVYSWTSARSGTEYVLALLPFGGFVKMLDSREGPVPSDEKAYAFDSKSLWQRSAIVSAGPLANLTLAVALYALVNWWGYMEPQARVSRPPAGSVAAQAGFSGGETVLQAGMQGEATTEVASFEALRWWLAKAALTGRDLQLVYLVEGQRQAQTTVLTLSQVDASQADATLFQTIGLVSPYAAPVLGDIMPRGAAEEAGLQPGDQVVRVDAVAVSDGAHLRELVRESGRAAAPRLQQWEIVRGGQPMRLAVTPRRETLGDATVGRIGAVVGAAPSMVLVRFGFWDGLGRSLVRTGEVSALTLRMFGQILVGNASLKNISGPITIADYAGKSARMGLIEFLGFLALISISLGVLNLLPLPVLDGGHLMYYLWEALTGKAVSDAWLDGLQRTGMALLLLLMGVAVFNDIVRLVA